ncbi:MAG: hypothetical protein Q7T30_02485 [Planctomycetota bacterium]|nr:hypothetical protein [Planctomycetota bacterium]
MKIPSARGQVRFPAVSRHDRLEVAIVVNQLATPGLGSWAAGHRIAGAGQMFIASIGFLFALVHFGRTMRELWDSTWAGIDPLLPEPTLMYRGFMIFAVAWIWSGITSLQMLAELRRRRLEPPPLPPRLDPPPDSSCPPFE